MPPAKNVRHTGECFARNATPLSHACRDFRIPELCLLLACCTHRCHAIKIYFTTWPPEKRLESMSYFKFRSKFCYSYLSNRQTNVRSDPFNFTPSEFRQETSSSGHRESVSRLLFPRAKMTEKYDGSRRTAIRYGSQNIKWAMTTIEGRGGEGTDRQTDRLRTTNVFGCQK